MSDQPAPPFAAGTPGGVFPVPLTVDDPPRIGDFWLDARLVAGPSGVCFLGHDADDSPVMLIQLNDGAARDAAARDRLAGEVNKLHIDTVVARGGHGQDQGRLGHTFRSEDDDPVAPDQTPLAPWVALAYNGTPEAVMEAERLLREVDLSRLGPLGAPKGPDYEMHWYTSVKPGTSRLWPLPWPGRHDRAGWVTMLVSALLMILMTLVALLIVVLIFQNAPPAAPPPPVPTSGDPSSQSQSPSSGSPSSQSPSSGSPSSQSPSSGSPSSASPSSGSPSSSGSESASQSPSSSGSSGSPTPSGSDSPTESGSPGTGSPSHQPSMESPDPSGTASGGGGSPSPNRRL